MAESVKVLKLISDVDESVNMVSQVVALCNAFHACEVTMSETDSDCSKEKGVGRFQELLATAAHRLEALEVELRQDVLDDFWRQREQRQKIILLRDGQHVDWHISSIPSYIKLRLQKPGVD